jgi:hypothetical protein
MSVQVFNTLKTSVVGNIESAHSGAKILVRRMFKAQQ